VAVPKMNMYKKLHDMNNCIWKGKY